ncbi:MAG: V-type ATPase subunit [Treponema sp.]|nr:V-type ATPase subunit [Treponema sp.]
MTDAGERAYAYTRACGIIGKSFVGRRISPLAGLRSLSEFDRMVFPEVNRELPGRELLLDIEGRIIRRTVWQILAVIDAYEKPPELLIRQLRSYEYADLKTCLNHLAGGIKTPPAFSDIGRFKTLRSDAYPGLEAMLSGTEFEFILSTDTLDIKKLKAGGCDTTAVEAELDLRYYTLLLRSLRRLPAADRVFAGRILAEEISLRNCVWALRLRTYFKKTAEETAPRLMDIKTRYGRAAIPGSIHTRASMTHNSGAGGEISLAAEAFESLNLPLDSRAAWQGWRWERFLNPQKEGELWTASPRFFQNAASEYLYRLSYQCFRRVPFSTSASFCYIKLKQFEEDLLTSVVEGLGLGMSGNDVIDLLGAASGEVR